MPEQQDGSGRAGKPDRDTLPDAPVNPSGDQTVPPNITNNSAANNEDDAGKIAKQIKSGEKWLIGIGVATLIINTAIGIIYWQQLQEMVGVSGQTDSLTRAYRRQERDITALAQETHNLAESSKSQSIATNTIAEDTAKANRAWMGIDGKLVLDSPITLKTRPIPFEQSVQGAFHYTVKNFGKDPAFLVNADTAIVSVTQLGDSIVYSKEVFRLQNMTCNAADKDTIDPTTATGNAVFPGNPLREDQPASFAAHGGDPTYPVLDPREPLTIVGCISYRDQYPTKKGSLHHTQFCYRSYVSIESLKTNDEFRQCTRFQNAQ